MQSSYNKNNREHQDQDQSHKQDSQNTFNKICTILQQSKTFKFHNIILHKSFPISPYILSTNGYINKFYLQQQQQHQQQQQQQQQEQKNIFSLQNGHILSTSCICLDSSCKKTLKFSTLLTQQFSQFQQQSLSQLLSEHQQTCQYYYQNKNDQMKRIQYKDLYENIYRIYNEKIFITYFGKEQRIKLKWNIIEELLAKNINHSINNNNINNIKNINNLTTSLTTQCYKSIDHNFNPLIKSYTSSLLLSIFGWKISTFSHIINHNKTTKLQCHYCGKQLSLDNNQIQQKQIDFYNPHHYWCMIKDKEYQVWKMIIKLIYLEDLKGKKDKHKDKDNTQNINLNNAIISNRQQKSESYRSTYIIPRTQGQLQAKQLQYELYQHIQPYLQRIDIIKKQSQQYSSTLKQINKERTKIIHDQHSHSHRHQYQYQQYNQQQNHHQQQQQQYKQHSQQQQTQNQYIQVSNNLNQIAHKSQEIIRHFINSIKINIKTIKTNNNNNNNNNSNNNNNININNNNNNINNNININ